MGTDNITGAVLDVWSTDPASGTVDILRTTSAECSLVDYMLLTTPIGVVSGFAWGGAPTAPPDSWLTPPNYCP